MTSFVTQCPHCRTSFRVSRTQLAAAHGVVRCGACMELFNAARHLHGDDATTNAGAAPAVDKLLSEPAVPPAKPAVSGDGTLWIHDDLDLDSLDLDEELAKLERQERELSRESLDLQSQTGNQHVQAEDRSLDDEAGAAQPSNAERDTLVTNPELQSRSAAPVEPPSNAADLHFTPVNDLNPMPPSPLAPRAPVNYGFDPQKRIEPMVDSLIAPDEQPPARFPASPNAEYQHSSDQSPRKDQADPLFELEDEPLQLDWEARRRPWGRWLGWGALNLIAVLALATQYVAYNFDEVARQDEYRPWLERICPALGCELPPRVDVSQIKSSNLVVRSHPEFAGALVVDAIIYNRAPFAQPFPLLEIRFDDINGQPQARRTFKPGEYLAGELAGQREMPSQVPIHIALDILDPGAKAVNYSLSFRSPE